MAAYLPRPLFTKRLVRLSFVINGCRFYFRNARGSVSIVFFSRLMITRFFLLSILINFRRPTTEFVVERRYHVFVVDITTMTTTVSWTDRTQIEQPPKSLTLAVVIQRLQIEFPFLSPWVPSRRRDAPRT